jgi:hypothetical protein
MATVTKIGLLQREGDQTVERYSVTTTRANGRTESKAFDITTKQIGRIEVVEGPVAADILSGKKTARIQAYPEFPAFLEDASGVTGLEDLAAGGTFTGTEPAYFEVKISSSVANPDQFQWRKNGGSWSSATGITGSAQTLSDGVTITFTAVNGHTLNDVWVITANPAANTFYVTLRGYGG